MKKVLLAVVLLAVVVVIAYLRFWRTSERQTEAFEAGRAAAETELAQFQSRVDSLKHLLAMHADNSLDSLEIERNDLLCRVDSLVSILDSIAPPSDSGLPPRLDSSLMVSAAVGADTVLPTEAPVADSGVQAPPADTALCREVMDYYRQLETELPSDLTRYERKVATYEISVKAARQFEITLAELKAIREAYGTSN